ncbi:MAG: TIGR03915 family putative DNA repair protein [Oscillospiraceae bacterium]
MPGQSDVKKMPCGRKAYCGNAKCGRSLYCIRLAERQRAADAPPQRRAQAGAPLAQPVDVVYLYDGSLPGFYCCVFESVYAHEIPQQIYAQGEEMPTLYQQKWIETDADKARRVRASIPKKIGRDAQELVETVFLSCLVEKELKMLRFLLLGYRQGPGVMHMLGHADVAPVTDAAKHLGGEAHLLKGFVRFSDYGGVLAATITPKNFILPFLAGHFTSRYSGEDFIIYDKTHKAALIYEGGQQRIVPMEGIAFPEANEEEARYRAMWKQFYNTIAIEARENPRCRMTHMPKRYWENMLEVQDLL